MEQPTLSDESNVTLLLTSHLGAAVDETSDDTLGPTQWHDFTRAVNESSIDSIGELLSFDTSELPATLFSDKISREWVTERLSNASRLALELEDLNQSGIWVTTEFEQSFPSQLIETLGRKAPPFLYVAGNAENFQPEAVGFVGSRDATDSDLEYTRDLADMALKDGFAVVSGGAKGVDSAAEEAGLNAAGPVIEFPAEGIKNSLSNNNLRESVLNGDLTIASMYRPDASWSIGGAMGRNKLIHGYGKYTFVIRSGDETGGTWEGATENLSNEFSELFVCTHQDDAPGNEKLISKGGVPIDPESKPAGTSLAEWATSKIDDNQNETDSSNKDSSEAVGETDADHQSSLEDF